MGETLGPIPHPKRFTYDGSGFEAQYHIYGLVWNEDELIVDFVGCLPRQTDVRSVLVVPVQDRGELTLE